jgi:CheY-like chemotaxis protein
MQATIDNKRKYGGFGLGLCIVKSLIDYKKGEIVINSTPGKGTEVKIKLKYPILETNVIEKPKEVVEKTVYDLNGSKVLIVEDNPINALVLKTMIGKWKNAQTVVATNGKEALNVLNSENIDIVIMDLQMPVMDGYECTRAIRNGEAGYENSNIPIIALTADVLESTKLKVFEIGMDAYFTKPFDQKILYEKVNYLLNEKIVS